MIEVILREDILTLGKAGEMVRVKPGYARNYLLPQGLAYEATEGNRKRIAAETRVRAARNQADLCVAHLATMIRGHGIGRERIAPYLLPSLDADGACAAAGAKALQGLAGRVRKS